MSINGLTKVKNSLVTLVKSKDIRQYSEETLYSFIKYLAGDDTAALDIGKETLKVLYQVPNIIFFDKLRVFLNSSYAKIDYGTRIKFSNKFTDENDKLESFVKRQIELIDSINDSKKIEYIASLTRALLLGFIDNNLYFKLANIVDKLTSEEIQYLGENIDKPIIKLNVYTFSFKNVGLIEQTIVPNTEEGKEQYSYTPLASAVDQFAIKIGNDKKGYTYNIDTPITLDNIDEYYNYSYKTTSNAKVFTAQEGKDIFEQGLEKVKKEYPDAIYEI